MTHSSINIEAPSNKAAISHQPHLRVYILLIPIYSSDMHDIQQSFGEGTKDANPVDVKWQETLDKVAAGVVSVKFCRTRSFDAEKAGSSEATGFVVDAEKGQVLNFHSGQTSAYVIIDISSQTDM